MKKTSKHEVDDQEVMRFNLKRENVKGKEFNQAEMRETLHTSLGYSKAAGMLRALSNGVNPPIIKIRRGVYCFNPKPVYKERLQTAWEEYTKMANPQCYKNGKHEHPVSIDQAIKVLKDAGYKVLRPVTQYEEC